MLLRAQARPPAGAVQGRRCGSRRGPAAVAARQVRAGGVTCVRCWPHKARQVLRLGSCRPPSQQSCASPPPLQAPWGSGRSLGLTCSAEKAGREGGSDAEGSGSSANGGGGAGGADWGRGQPPSPLQLPVEGSPALLQQCMERARGVVKVIEGRQFVPLEEASLSRNSALSTSAAARTNLLA